MGHENRKVLLFPAIKDMLEAEGWSLYLSFNKEYLFKNEDGEILAIPQHPKKPQMVYLDDILKCTMILRQKFIELARPEWDLSSDNSIDSQIQFNIWLDPGDADVSDIQELFTTLSDLNRAAGGYGLDFNETQATTL